MLKIMILIVSFLFTLSFVNSALYEARNSDDIDFFLAHNPEENGALMFYDPNQEQDAEIAKSVDKAVGIFRNIGEEGRSEEEWVDSLNDKVHLMRIDATNVDNARSVNDFRVSTTPLLFLLDNGDIQLMEIVNSKTYDHIKDFYQEKIRKRQENEENNDGNGDENDELLKTAQKAADEAKQAAAQAIKALEEAKKALEDHINEGHKGDDSDNKEDSDECSLPDYKKDQIKGSQSNKNQKSQSRSSQNSNLSGYQVEYVPVLRKIDNTYSAQTQQTPSTVRYVNHGDHWHSVSN